MNMGLLFLFLFSLRCYSMGVDEITSLAIERSSLLSAQEMEGRALKSEANLKGKWQNPQLMGQFGALKSGPFEGGTIEVSLTQPVPLSDKYSLRKEIATIATDNHKLQSAFFKEWVSHQAVLATWKVYVTNELLKHSKKRRNRLGLVKKYLETRPKVTIKQKIELSIISSTLIQLEKSEDQKKYNYEMAKDDLSFWIGKSLDQSQIPFSLPDQYKLIENYQLDISNDVEFTSAKNTVKMSLLDHDLASKERRPDIFLGGGFRKENAIINNHFSYVIVGLNIPIWDTGYNRLEAAKAREMRDKKKLEQIERERFLKQKILVENLKFSVDQIKRFPKKLILHNEQSLHDAEIGFRQGLLDVNTFLLAETQSHEIIDQVYISWVSYLEVLSTLQLMKGEKFNWEMN